MCFVNKVTVVHLCLFKFLLVVKLGYEGDYELVGEISYGEISRRLLCSAYKRNCKRQSVTTEYNNYNSL